MKISIIVPVYNGEIHLKRCLDSLISQTLSDIEILIVNDGSTDSSQQIVEKYCKLYSHVSLINKENAGLPQARKTGIKNAGGDFIGFVDADDWVEPDMYQKLYHACVQYDAEVACCGYYWQYDKKCVASNKPSDDVRSMNGGEALEQLHTRKAIYPYAWNKLYKKELFENVIFPTGNFVGEDYAVTTQILCTSHTIVWIPQPYYHYVQSKNSMCRGGYSDNYLIAYDSYKNICPNLIRQFPSQKESIENYFLTEIAAFVVAMGKNNHYNQNMISDVVNYAKKHRKQYLQAAYVNKKYKISILSLCINYKILIYGYKFVAYLQQHMFLSH